MSKSKAHIRYKLADKTIVPGITTVIGILNKPALVNWANKLGLAGIDVTKYVDEKANIGTIAHQIVTNYLTGVESAFDDYSKNEIAEAENSFLSFLEWEKQNTIIKPAIFVERPLVHEELRYGGTADIYAMVNGKPTLIELKTGKGIFPEHVYQCAANVQLLQYHGSPVESVIILNIPRTPDEGFDAKVCSRREIDNGWEIFKHLLTIYNLRKEV